MEACPNSHLRLEWLLPDPLLLGGPPADVSYLVEYRREGVGSYTQRTFNYSSSVTVSCCNTQIFCVKAVMKLAIPTLFN